MIKIIILKIKNHPIISRRMLTNHIETPAVYDLSKFVAKLLKFDSYTVKNAKTIAQTFFGT